MIDTTMNRQSDYIFHKDSYLEPFLQGVRGENTAHEGDFGVENIFYITDNEEENKMMLYHVGRGMGSGLFEKAIRPHIGLETSLYIKTSFSTMPMGDTFMPTIGLRMKSYVSKVKEQPIVYKFVTDFNQIPSDYHACNFCGGHTKNDMRGHCCACGAPRGW